jgi:hypothetical protein
MIGRHAEPIESPSFWQPGYLVESHREAGRIAVRVKSCGARWET